MRTDPAPGKKTLDFSATGRARVVAVAIVVTFACIVVSQSLMVLGIVPVDHAGLGQRIAVNIITPISVAFPVMYFLMGKMRELAIAHQKLIVYASTDSLTQVLNRAAFSTLVDAYLAEIRSHEAQTRGALLIIDADNFKSVNDSYGHDRGDEALVKIAAAIQSMLRAPDMVGRLGGEEFGVFLPGASPDRAAIVAERIRTTVSMAEFTPRGSRHKLSVSVGGAVFQRALPFSDLFRQADQQLYSAKQNGRNRVSIAMAENPPLSLAAA
ncbi:MAG: GGDEF domain-containing protein [Devosia sp.]